MKLAGALFCVVLAGCTTYPVGLCVGICKIDMRTPAQSAAAQIAGGLGDLLVKHWNKK